MVTLQCKVTNLPFMKDISYSLCAIFLASAVSSSAAVVIQQAPSDTRLIFEAESYDSIVSADGKGFVLVTQSAPFTSAFGTEILGSGSDASGGAAILDDLRVSNADHSSTVTYKLSFATSGSYRLYLRTSVFEDNSNTFNYLNEDSVFLPSGFDSAADVTEAITTIGGYREGDFDWHNTAVNFVVDPSEVGQVISFNIDDRESGLAIDRIAFSNVTNEQSSTLDALSNATIVPEPSLIGLTSLGTAIIAFRRRRSRAK